MADPLLAGEWALASDSPWRWIFRVKGVWNCLLTTALFFLDAPLREVLGMAPADPLYRDMFLALAFSFGIGYWQVGGDLRSNRAVVVMGVIGQISVFVSAGYHFLRGQVHWAYLGPAVVDLTFAVLFVWFLLRTQPARS
jgi:hypothetical protein